MTLTTICNVAERSPENEFVTGPRGMTRAQNCLVRSLEYVRALGEGSRKEGLFVYDKAHLRTQRRASLEHCYRL